MNKNKKSKHKWKGISIKYLLTFFVVLCLVSVGINLYLHANFQERFEKEESPIEEGKSELNISKDGKYKYRINEKDKTVDIIDYLKTDVEDLIVPEVIDGMTVTSVTAINYHDELKTIRIPKTVKNIGMAVFCFDVNLKEAYFPGEIDTIETWAFDDWNGTIVTIKNSKLFKYAEENNINVREIESEE